MADQAGAEIAHQIVERGRGVNLRLVRLELRPMLRVDVPPPTEGQHLPWLHLRQAAHHCDRLATTADAQTQDGKPVVRIVEGDALDAALQGECRVRSSGGGRDRCRCHRSDAYLP